MLAGKQSLLTCHIHIGKYAGDLLTMGKRTRCILNMMWLINKDVHAETKVVNNCVVSSSPTRTHTPSPTRIISIENIALHCVFIFILNSCFSSIPVPSHQPDEKHTMNWVFHAPTYSGYRPQKPFPDIHILFNLHIFQTFWHILRIHKWMNWCTGFPIISPRSVCQKQEETREIDRSDIGYDPIVSSQYCDSTACTCTKYRQLI